MEKIFHWANTFKAIEHDDGSIDIKGSASTNALDRAGDIIEPTAWTKGGLDSFKNNPIILFNHNHDRPIGRAKEIGVSEKGLGGLLILIVAGNLTVGASGVITSQGGRGGAETSGKNWCSGGGAGGGGRLIYAYGGTLSNSGSITAAGGESNTASALADPNYSGPGGLGGAGVVTGLAVSSTAYLDLTLQSTDTTASTANPDYADMVILMEDEAGTATLNTDIKGYISEDSGVTFTQGTLVDEGSWGTNKKIVAFHDLDISAQSGSSMCYKITTHNQSVSKITNIHATSIGWR